MGSVWVSNGRWPCLKFSTQAEGKARKAAVYGDLATRTAVKYLFGPIIMFLRFLYRLFVGLDVNFRLKRRMISSEATDPSLSKGWSYFVEEGDYKAFLRTFGTLVIQEVSTINLLAGNRLF